MHTYDLKDKTGRPLLWIRFTQYKKGVWDRERSKKYLVYIFELLEQKAGGKGFTMIGDGKDCASENVDVDLIYHLIEVLEKYYPGAIYRSVALDLPQFFIDIMTEVIKNLTPSLKDTVSFINAPQLTEVLNQDQIPAYKLKTLATPKP